MSPNQSLKRPSVVSRVNPTENVHCSPVLVDSRSIDLLHDQSKGRKDTREHDRQAVAARQIQRGLRTVLIGAGSRRCVTGVAAGRAGGIGAVSAGCLGAAGGAGGVGAVSLVRRRRVGLGGWGRAGGGAGAARSWVLGSARVVDAASGLAGRVVGTAGGDTLVSVLGALEVGDGLRVAGGAGGLAVAADALVVEGFLSSELAGRARMEEAMGWLTGSQVFVSVVDEDPSSWRQSKGHAAL